MSTRNGFLAYIISIKKRRLDRSLNSREAKNSNFDSAESHFNGSEVPSQGKDQCPLFPIEGFLHCEVDGIIFAGTWRIIQ